MCLFFFFFQAEDGIRDLYVTGVQTCALPISSSVAPPWSQLRQDGTANVVSRSATYSANFITDLYQNALGRSASASEVDNIQLPDYVRAPSLEPLVHGIVASTEAQTHQINGWYQLYLNRSPDLGGLHSFLNFLNAGQSYASAQAI